LSFFGRRSWVGFKRGLFETAPATCLRSLNQKKLGEEGCLAVLDLHNGSSRRQTVFSFSFYGDVSLNIASLGTRTPVFLPNIFSPQLDWLKFELDFSEAGFTGAGVFFSSINILIFF
jgi:hypothetical protein